MHYNTSKDPYCRNNDDVVGIADIYSSLVNLRLRESHIIHRLQRNRTITLL